MVKPLRNDFNIARVTLVLAFVVLYALSIALPNYAPAVCTAKPLIITIAKNGSDEMACLSGKIPCKTFTYPANSSLDANSTNVTMIITYPQQMPNQQITFGGGPRSRLYDSLSIASWTRT